ncbi:unnamed protein product [Calypogeia fissa]
MPYTTRTLTGSISDLFHPSFRKIQFDDSFAIVVVSTHLRYAWTALPGEDTSVKAVSSFIGDSHRRTEEERSAVPQNPDSNDIRTPWREGIYYHWNHVLYDIANFLVEVGPGMGYFYPPAHEVMAVNYPDKGVGDGGEVEEIGIKMVWKTNVLVLPAHLESKVSIRMDEIGAEMGEGGSAETNSKTVGRFDGSNVSEIWYFKEGTEVRIFVEGEYGEDRRGVAAVLVYGKMAPTSPEGEEKEEEEEEEDS